MQFAVFRNYSSGPLAVLQYSAWKSNPEDLREFLKNTTASGGQGNEAIEIGLWHANQQADVRRVILIGDAPGNTDKETADKIDAAIANSRQGTVNCDKVGDALKQILSKVTETDTLVSEIASSADDQSKGIEQINSAIMQMDQVAQANATSAQQCASSAEELQSQTLELNSVVSSLSDLVGLTGRSAEESSATQTTENEAGDAPVAEKGKSKGTFI
jgi:uncharacterized phage infection (PIP) family protein YhgE